LPISSHSMHFLSLRAESWTDPHFPLPPPASLRSVLLPPRRTRCSLRVSSRSCSAFRSDLGSMSTSSSSGGTPSFRSASQARYGKRPILSPGPLRFLHTRRLGSSHCTLIVWRGMRHRGGQALRATSDSGRSLPSSRLSRTQGVLPSTAFILQAGSPG